jgi:LAO/AO transport system kinase
MTDNRRYNMSQRKGLNMDEAIEREMRASLVGGKLPCAVAFRIAKELGVASKVVGDAANRLNIKIAKCQLGCFP